MKMEPAASLISSNMVMVAVCTRKRPELLEICLASLLRQNFPAGSFTPVIAVIDNDPQQSAFPVYKRATDGCGLWTSYIPAPKLGIAAARNAAIDHAIENGIPYLCFIDDDEVAHSDWLAGLMHPDYLSAPIVGGLHQMTYFQIPNWAAPVNPKKRKPEGSHVECAYCNNVRIHSSVFSKLRFDEGLGLGGGEDEDYFTRAFLAGYEMRFTQRAVTNEMAHPERYTVRGIFARSYWTAASNMRCRIMREGRVRAIARKAPSLALGPIGAACQFTVGVLICPVDRMGGFRMMIRGGKTLARHTGRLAALMGHIPQPYRSVVGR